MRLRSLALVLAAVALGCGSPDTPRDPGPGKDADARHDPGVADAAPIPDDRPGTDGSWDPSATEVLPGDPGFLDPAVDLPDRPDAPGPEDAVAVDGTETDASTDAGTDAGGPGPFCSRATACGNAATCNLCSGQCEARSPGWSPFAALSAYPAAGAPGDYLVIDGAGFSGLTSVQVGGSSLARNADENRIVATRGEGANGTLKVGGTSFPAPIVTSSGYAGVQACQPTDPPATGVVPADPAEIGPWAVGFADKTGGLFGPRVRAYYPATCGGLRKPPADGKFPFVVFVHGDGYVPLNFEYLARHLASWGFLAAIPENVDHSIVKTGRTAPGDWFAPLAGHQTNGDAAVVCHSKGAEYTYNLGLGNIRAVVFLGPVYTMESPYGSLFPIQGLVMGGSEDGAPTADRCQDVYDQVQTPKYLVMVKRGTHGQFLDDKMWEPPSDGSGVYVARNRQHEIVQAFTLAYLQRVFGQAESFPGWLEAPGLADEIRAWHEP